MPGTQGEKCSHNKTVLLVGRELKFNLIGSWRGERVQSAFAVLNACFYIHLSVCLCICCFSLLFKDYLCFYLFILKRCFLKFTFFFPVFIHPSVYPFVSFFLS